MQRTAGSTIGTFHALVLMARPSQVALVILVFTAGVLLAAWRGMAGGSDPWSMTTGLTLLLTTTVAVHWANEAADAATDARSRRTPFSGGSGALPSSRLAPDVPLGLALGLAIVTLIAAAALTTVGALTPIASLLLIAGLVGGLAYSLPPVAAMRRGIGEPLNALLGGLLLPLYGFAVAADHLEPTAVLAFLPFTAVVFCSVLATAWPDREADAATGKDTLQVRLPIASLRRLHSAAMTCWLAATLAVMATGALPFPAAGLLVGPLLLLGHAWYTTDRSPWPSVAAMVGSVGVTTIGLLVALA